MTVLVAVLVGAAITAPHVLRLESAHPATAAMIWFAAVCLRALVALFVALFVVFHVPTTALFEMVTHWCWHTALPLVTSHLGLSGHSVGDVALLAPVLALSVSLLSVCVGLWRATRGRRPGGAFPPGRRRTRSRAGAAVRRPPTSRSCAKPTRLTARSST